MDRAEDICSRLEALDRKLLHARRQVDRPGAKHTAWGHPELSLPQITRPICSAGLYKMLEMSPHLPESPQTITCLCEAPGGFAQALALLHPKCKISVVSLNCDIKFSVYLPKTCHVWRHKRRKSSDIRDRSVRSALLKWRHDQDVVTADGGTDDHDHDAAESIAYALVHAEASVGTSMLREGGCLVLKFLQGTNPATRVLLARLEAAFKCVKVIKPLSSRRWNSERYAICTDKRAELRSVTLECILYEATAIAGTHSVVSNMRAD